MKDIIGVPYDEWERCVPMTPAYWNDRDFVKEWAKKLESVVAGYMVSPVIKIEGVEYKAKTVSCKYVDIESITNHISGFTKDNYILFFDASMYKSVNPYTYMTDTGIMVRFAAIPKMKDEL
jgi:hypothetical protein